MSHRFLAAFLVLLLALLIQITVQDIFGVSFGLAWATLFAAAFFLDLGEMVVMELFTIFILSWQPAPSFETVVFALMPILALLTRKFMPLMPYLGSLFFIGVSPTLMYLIFSPGFFISRPGLFVLDLSASLLWGALSFWMLNFSET